MKEFTGLTNKEVIESRKKNGSNTAYESTKKNAFTHRVLHLLKEPMVLILLVASTLYFVGGEVWDGLFLILTIFFIAAISFYQEFKSDQAVEKLNELTLPESKVIRNGEAQIIKSTDIVVADLVIVEEGGLIPADGIIIHSNDFSVDESILTGESFAIDKNVNEANNLVFAGSTVTRGLGIIHVTTIGEKTKLGKLGKFIDSVHNEKTKLEVQIDNFIKKMVIVGAIIFLLVLSINFMESFDLKDSLLKSLTLALSVLPEEIPVAFTTFMAIGSWRLAKLGIIAKQMKTVEALGSATVICTDKTGTLTKNEMQLAKVFTLEDLCVSDLGSNLSINEILLIKTAMWSSEPIPFDPMEIALHDAYLKYCNEDLRDDYELVKEYPLSGTPPMMTHVWENNSGLRIISTKGAPEAIISVSQLSSYEKQQVIAAMEQMANEGYRVLGVARAVHSGDTYPDNQHNFNFHFEGLVGFYDPPKNNIQEVLEEAKQAGVEVKIITGDNAKTTQSIAQQIHFEGADKEISGERLMKLDDEALKVIVKETKVFTRMFPVAKLRIINALKDNGEVVAMLGDGINDAPALKAAHIGVAMGKKGTEIAKQASDLILLKDDLSKLVEAMAMGRKIYSNLKKAIRYIISIHIPIILVVTIPLALGWLYPSIFSPIHVIVLELIMGPTCSIVFENEPIEQHIMHQKPNKYSSNFFNSKELWTSITQGLVITIGALMMYKYAIWMQWNEASVRTLVFTVLIFANIFLTFINRSFYYSIFKTATYSNRLIQLVISITIGIYLLMIKVPFITRFFGFESPTFLQVSYSICLAFLSVIWFEVIKWIKRKKYPIKKDFVCAYPGE